jgi:hypothetical protein
MGPAAKGESWLVPAAGGGVPACFPPREGQDRLPHLAMRAYFWPNQLTIHLSQDTLSRLVRAGFLAVQSAVMGGAAKGWGGKI